MKEQYREFETATLPETIRLLTSILRSGCIATSLGCERSKLRPWRIPYAAIGRCYVQKVRRLTPPTIYKASVALNYAFTKAVVDMQSDPQPLRPYQGMSEASVGERLYPIIHSIGDDQHVGDVVTTDRWAHELSLSGWYRWVKMEEVQGSSYSLAST